MATIAFGLDNYVDEHGALPPAYTVDEDGKPLHSWRTLILPYMEMDYGALADKIDLTKPWNDPANKEARETAVHIYQCPSTDVPETHTVYLGVVVPGGCFQPGKPRRLSDITDSRDTLMVVEVDIEHSVHWMAPTDADEKWLASFGSGTMPHPGGFHTLGVNGSLRFETEDIEPARLRAMISIAGGD